MTAGEKPSSAVRDSDQNWEQLHCSGRKGEVAGGAAYLHALSLFGEGSETFCR
jgi:hypothetical protein